MNKTIALLSLLMTFPAIGYGETLTRDVIKATSELQVAGEPVLAQGTTLTGAGLDFSTLSSTQTLPAGGCMGQHYYINGAYTITLPAVEEDNWCCFQVIGAAIAKVQPAGGEYMYIDGTASGSGVGAVSDETTGEILCVGYYDSDHYATWVLNNWVSE